MGQAAFVNHVLLLAVTRMLFLFGASFFFLAGIANLQQKRCSSASSKAEQAREVAELTRLTEELQRRGNELEDANRRIQEADRLKSQFLANMSHELRTPMNSIIGFSEILIERLDDAASSRSTSASSAHILTSGQHLLGIINDILDLSKIEAGKMEIYAGDVRRCAPVDRERLPRSCAACRRRKTITFVVDVAPSLPRDRDRSRQVQADPLQPALERGEVLAAPSRRHDSRAATSATTIGRIIASRRRRGIGIEPKNHDVIFEEFRQVDGTAAPRVRRHGPRPLAGEEVRRAAGRHGHASTATLGEGSTFTFTLPIHFAARPCVSPIAGARRPRIPRGERVLVVEDDAHAYDTASRPRLQLRRLSCPIRARNGDEALRLAREHPPGGHHARPRPPRHRRMGGAEAR